ncbi:hypothetical protein K5X82_07710 [Halosquirtibacter xylanolyticus]|uniref:hypothetical protein n=1 Tax=Halosquirtibacter xylanolyticus TaxID=3374599 RepID=UPI00374878E3|nr:hypothetical protein K5X82_07710 [Prolixibacteraceae bacterium]
MKKILFICVCLSAMLCSSCATIFTASSQRLTFDTEGVKNVMIYDQNGSKLGKTDEEGILEVNVHKELTSPVFTAKAEGYERERFKLNGGFNGVAAINLLFWPGFIVDLATGQICNYKQTNYILEMEKKEN